MRDPQPYVDLSIAIVRQAVLDAQAGYPDAREFLLSPGGLQLVADLGLSPGYVVRLLAFPLSSGSLDGTDSAPDPDPVQWLAVKEIARRFGYHPERVRQLIRQGKVEAVKGTGRAGWLVNAASVQHYQDSLSPNRPITAPSEPG